MSNQTMSEAIEEAVSQVQAVVPVIGFNLVDHPLGPAVQITVPLNLGVPKGEPGQVIVKGDDGRSQWVAVNQMPTHILPENPMNIAYLPAVLADTGLAKSNTEGRRLIQEGKVRLDGTAVDATVFGRAELAGRILSSGEGQTVMLSE